MLYIKCSTGGQLGNQIMMLNTFIQLSNILNTKYTIINPNHILNDIYEYFDIYTNNNECIKNNNILMHPTDLYKIDITELIKIHNNSNIYFDGMFLGDFFYKYTIIDPKQIIKIKPSKQILLPENKTNIGIHIRYFQEYSNSGDILKKYYIDSINHCLKEYNNCHFIIFGVTNYKQFAIKEDALITKYNFFNELINYLNSHKINYSFSITIQDSNKHYINYFIQLSNCDIIISSISTFAICAGYLGKDKKIIHCEALIKKLVNELKDIFWVNLYNGGNKYYHIWKLF